MGAHLPRISEILARRMRSIATQLRCRHLHERVRRNVLVLNKLSGAVSTQQYYATSYIREEGTQIALGRKLSYERRAKVHTVQ